MKAFFDSWKYKWFVSSGNEVKEHSEKNWTVIKYSQNNNNRNSNESYSDNKDIQVMDTFCLLGSTINQVLFF